MGIDWDTWEHFHIADFELKTLSNIPPSVCSTGILDQVVQQDALRWTTV